MASHFFTAIPRPFILFLAILASGVKLSTSTSITLINNCKETVWPGITTNNNDKGDGFALKPGQSAVFAAPSGWNGRIWGRTGCNFDKTGNSTRPCQTGSCGSTVKCTGPGQPPASIAEFTLGDPHFYDVSLVDGFNLPIVVKPVNGKGNCSVVGCDKDLRQKCPPELALNSGGKTVACRSACNVFNTEEYCCRGAYNTPASCLPTNYSRSFKSACPVAYSFAFDDATSVITCSAADYVLSFCSSRNQTQCRVGDNKAPCNEGKGVEALLKPWQIMAVVAFPTVMNLGVLL